MDVAILSKIKLSDSWIILILDAIRVYLMDWKTFIFKLFLCQCGTFLYNNQYWHHHYTTQNYTSSVVYAMVHIPYQIVSYISTYTYKRYMRNIPDLHSYPEILDIPGFLTWYQGLNSKNTFTIIRLHLILFGFHIYCIYYWTIS